MALALDRPAEQMTRVEQGQKVQPRAAQLPALTGLRAVAALLVVIHHFTLYWCAGALTFTGPAIILTRCSSPVMPE